ncbi:hypothetical protein [Emticicia fontis]
MKLIDLIKDIDSVDENFIIFQEDLDNRDSDIILSPIDENDGVIKEEAGRKYHYLIEVFLVKDFIEAWKANINNNPDFEEVTKRLHDYAINDA